MNRCFQLAESSAFSYGAKFGISVGIKGLGDASSEVSMQTSITNEASSSYVLFQMTMPGFAHRCLISFASEVNTESTLKFAYKHEDGKNPSALRIS